LFLINLLLLSAYVRLGNTGAGIWQLAGKVVSQFVNFSSSYKFCIWTFPTGYSKPAVAKDNPPDGRLVLPEPSTSALSILNFSNWPTPCSKCFRS